MNNSKIKITEIIDAEVEKVWNYYNEPSHIVNWNFADPSWHCPSAENDLSIGGTYKARMEAKDGSFGFDFEAIYTEISKIIQKIINHENQFLSHIRWQLPRSYDVLQRMFGW